MALGAEQPVTGRIRGFSSRSAATLLWGALSLAGLCAPVDDAAAEPAADWGWLSGDWQADTVTGNWGGERDRLADSGVTFDLDYLGQFAANPVGGATEGGASWIGSWTLGARIDLQEALAAAFPIYFKTSLDLQTGNIGLSQNYIGNELAVQVSANGDAGPQIRLVNLALGAALFDGTTDIVAGRIVTGDDFATIDQACTSLNEAVCGNPFAGGLDVSFPADPVAAWGGRIKIAPSQAWYAQAGAYLVYPTIFDVDNYGVELGAPSGSGILAIGEIGLNAGARAGQAGLPGTYKAGLYYDSERLTNLLTGAGQRDTWGVYAMGEQMLYSEDKTDAEGLWAWLSLSYAPPDVNEIEFMAAGGLSYVGLLPGRPDDALSFIAATAQFSDYLTGQGAETVLELNYKAQLLPAVYVQPDIQFVIHPEGYSTIEDALVIGFAIGATF